MKSKATKSIEFVVETQQSYPKLGLKITRTVLLLPGKAIPQKHPLPGKVERVEGNRFIPSVVSSDGTVYWLSIDRSNWVLRYGKYYTSKALTLVSVQLDASSGKWLEGLTTVRVHDDSKVRALRF